MTKSNSNAKRCCHRIQQLPLLRGWMQICYVIQAGFRSIQGALEALPRGPQKDALLRQNLERSHPPIEVLPWRVVD